MPHQDELRAQAAELQRTRDENEAGLKATLESQAAHLLAGQKQHHEQLDAQAAALAAHQAELNKAAQVRADAQEAMTNKVSKSAEMLG